MTLSIPAPCAQRWADMTPLRTDCRHCAACERQITDFSTKTDAEILAHLRSSGGKVCGRFRPDQLGRPLVAARSNLRRGGLTAAAASVAAVLVAQQPAAPVPPQPVELHQPVARERVLTEKRVEKDSMRTISGKIVDSETGEPLPGSTVSVEGTELGAVAQLDGTFQLQLPLDFVQKGAVELIFTYNGYEKQSLTLPQTSAWEGLAILPIKMATDAEIHLQGTLGFVEYHDYPEPSPLLPPPRRPEITAYQEYPESLRKPTLKTRLRHFFQKIF